MVTVSVCIYVEGLWSLEPNRSLDRAGGGQRRASRSFSTAVHVDGVGGHLYRPSPSVHGFHSDTVFSFYRQQRPASVASATTPTTSIVSTIAFFVATRRRSRGRRSYPRHRIPRWWGILSWSILSSFLLRLRLCLLFCNRTKKKHQKNALSLFWLFSSTRRKVVTPLMSVQTSISWTNMDFLDSFFILSSFFFFLTLLSSTQTGLILIQSGPSAVWIRKLLWANDWMKERKKS